MTINRNEALPLYYQLKHWILEQIKNGKYSVGDQVPSEVELCRQFNLSRGTVRQALKELIDEGRLYLVRGRGTFVSKEQKTTWVLTDILSMAQYFKNKGIEYETKVLEVVSIEADNYVAGKLHIEPGTKMVYTNRLRLVNNEPFVLFSSHLPEKNAGRLLEIDLSNKSLYQALEEVCGIKIIYSDHTVSARLASKVEADLLNISESEPVLIFDEIAYNEDGNPIEYSQSIFNSDLGHFFFRSKRTIL